jgi:hypothetical protein
LTSVSATEVSDVTLSISGQGQETHVPLRTLKDNNGLLHHQVCYPITVGKNGKKSTLTRLCKLCKEKEGAITVSLVVKQIPLVASISKIRNAIVSKNMLKTLSEQVSV